MTNATQEALDKAIRVSAEKAEKSDNSNDALKYTQAALNAAHALTTVKEMSKI